jgi:hypothetical protein
MCALRRFGEMLRGGERVLGSGGVNLELAPCDGKGRSKLCFADQFARRSGKPLDDTLPPFDRADVTDAMQRHHVKGGLIIVAEGSELAANGSMLGHRH